MLSVFIFISYPLVTILHLESLENKLFEEGFSISKKERVSTIRPSQEDDIFARLGHQTLFTKKI